MLREECGLTGASVVADVGSGTGILSRLFLKNGNRVFGVEPNREMREAGERLLGGYASFTSVPGTAEATTLRNGSVDLVTAGQAFHWFQAEETRREFARVLRPGGWAVLVWNERRTRSTPFLAAYERLLRAYGTDYEAVARQHADEESLARFFGPGGFGLRTLDNAQVFEFEGLRGRLLSSSYVPGPDHPDHGPMLEELGEVFQTHQSGGTVTVEYDTRVYYGCPGA